MEQVRFKDGVRCSNLGVEIIFILSTIETPTTTNCHRDSGGLVVGGGVVVVGGYKHDSHNSTWRVTEGKERAEIFSR